jgi:Uncharacterized protein conserved in bacteria
MDIALILLGFLFSVAGIIGCVLPALPGPPLSFLGLLLIHFTDKISLSPTVLWIMAGLTIVSSVLDYFIPIWGTKMYGGSKYGVRGATAGLVVGFFAGPAGLILGPFFGAMVGEMLTDRTGMDVIKAAFGSLMGFLLSIGLKLIVSLMMFFYFWVYVLPVVF